MRLAPADRDRSPKDRNINGVDAVCHTSKGDREAWHEFASDLIRLRRTVAAICAALIHGGGPWLMREDMRLSLVGYDHRGESGYARQISVPSKVCLMRYSSSSHLQ